MNIRRLSLAVAASLGFAGAPVFAAAAPDAAPAAPSPSGALRPVGVIVATAQTLWYDAGSGQYVFRKLGETANGAQIVAFDPSHVVLEADGARQVWSLTIAPTCLPAGLATTSTAPVAAAAPVAEAPPIAAAPVAAPAPVAPVAAAPAPAPVAAAPAPAPVVAAPAPAPVAVAPIPPAPTELPPSSNGTATVMARAIPRADLDRELSDFGAIGRQVGITARPEGGFQLAHVVGFASRVGLRDGDVILRVDGRNLASLEDAARAYAWLRLTDHFSIDILRGGQPQRLHFVITPASEPQARQAKR